MGERVHKSFRLPTDLASELDSFAGSNGLSATAVAEAALRDYLSRGTPRGTERGTQDAGRGTEDDGGRGFQSATGSETVGISEAIEALTAQLAVKDDQIATRDRHIAELMARLADAQATARAAQALEGAQFAKALGESAGPVIVPTDSEDLADSMDPVDPVRSEESADPEDQDQDPVRMTEETGSTETAGVERMGFLRRLARRFLSQ